MVIPRWEHLRSDLERLHAAALAVANPETAVRSHLRVEVGALLAGSHEVRLAPGARVFLVAAGKASIGMTRGAEDVLGARLHAGVVASPRAENVDPGAAGAGSPSSGDESRRPRLRHFAAGHPFPDEGSLAAGGAVEEMLRGTTPDDVVLALLSGGGSALLDLPHNGIDLATLKDLTRELQHAGADIQELNVVRRALSRLKGGGLLRLAAPARVVSLLLSDVIGDDPAAIASGPGVPSPTGPEAALAVLERHGLAGRFASIGGCIRGAHVESVSAPAPIFVLVGTNRAAAEAATAEAARMGFGALLVTTRLQGEAREIGRLLGGIARTMRENAMPLAPPACLVLGGETTVTVRGPGRGGRNHELALGAATTLEGCDRAAVFAFATDGVDGSSGAAGAIATGDTIVRARALDLSPQSALADSDTGPFFRRLGDSFAPGPSGTNVNDLAILLAYA